MLFNLDGLSMSLQRPLLLNSRQSEQTCPPDIHIQMSTPVKLPQTLVRAELLDSAAAGGWTVGPVADSVSPSRATTDTVLPQSSKTLVTLCGFHFSFAAFPM